MGDGAAEHDRLGEADAQLAAGHDNGDERVDEASPVRDGGGRARARAARERLADAAFPDAHAQPVAGFDGHELDVRALREPLVAFEARAVLHDARLVGIVDKEHEVRIAHAGRVAAVRHAVKGGLEVDRARRVEPDRRRVERHRAHVDVGGDDLAAAPRSSATNRRPAAVSTINESADPSPSRAATYARQRRPLPLSSAESAVGVAQCHARSRHPRSREQREQSVGADTTVPVAQRGRDGRASSGSRVWCTRKSLPVACNFAR